MTALGRTLKISAGMIATAALLAPAANAGVLVKTTQSCDAQTLSQPFARFGDRARYTPVPGGSFEAGSQAWTLTGGALVVTGNESFNVRAAGDSRSLYLPQGATATSPAMCVGISHPTLRWFGKQSGSLLGITGAMSAEVLFEDSLGTVVALPIGAGLLSTSWEPSLPAVVTANLLPLLPGEMTPVAFRFRAVSGNWNIDDAYVDPYAKW